MISSASAALIAWRNSRYALAAVVRWSFATPACQWRTGEGSTAPIAWSPTVGSM